MVTVDEIMEAVEDDAIEKGDNVELPEPEPEKELDFDEQTG